MDLLRHLSDPDPDPGGASDEPSDVGEIDFERAIWDADYRSRVLDLLRRTQSGPKDKAETEPRTPENDEVDS